LERVVGKGGRRHTQAFPSRVTQTYLQAFDAAFDALGFIIVLRRHCCLLGSAQVTDPRCMERPGHQCGCWRPKQHASTAWQLLPQQAAPQQTAINCNLRCCHSRQHHNKLQPALQVPTTSNPMHVLANPSDFNSRSNEYYDISCAAQVAGGRATHATSATPIASNQTHQLSQHPRECPG